jgi:hypothetical protein
LLPNCLRSTKRASPPVETRTAARELWNNLRTVLQGRFSIPDDDALHADLTSDKYESSCRLLLGLKADMKRCGTMTGSYGASLRDANTGQRIEMRLLPGESETAPAKRFTHRIRRATHVDETAGFHRPIRYGKSGLA